MLKHKVTSKKLIQSFISKKQAPSVVATKLNAVQIILRQCLINWNGPDFNTLM